LQRYIAGITLDADDDDDDYGSGSSGNGGEFDRRGFSGGLCTLNQVDPYPITYNLSNP
jgi:hypothetical protein